LLIVLQKPLANDTGTNVAIIRFAAPPVEIGVQPSPQLSPSCSDIDLALVSAKQIPPRAMGRLQHELLGQSLEIDLQLVVVHPIQFIQILLSNSGGNVFPHCILVSRWH
jgi:hypothetical protein